MTSYNKEYIRKIKDAIRRYNNRYCIKQGGDIHKAIFKLVIGLITLVLLLILVFGALALILRPMRLLGFHMDFVVDNINWLFAFAFVIVMSIVLKRYFQLRDQKEEHGDYVDYKSDGEDYEVGFGMFTKKMYKIPVIDFIAHNLVTIFTEQEYQGKPEIKLSDKQLKLAELILIKTEDNAILKLDEFEKASEFNLCTDREKVYTLNMLKELDFIAISNKPGEKFILQIDEPASDWIVS